MNNTPGKIWRMVRMLRTEFSGCKRRAGFTLIETLAAITLLIVAIVSPMILTERALTSAYYARDQITAYYLAQEAIEFVHQKRDNRILEIAKNVNTSADLFGDIAPHINGPFTIDATNGQIADCSGTCPPLQTDGQLYGYAAGHSGTWTNTNFIRTVTACYVQAPPLTGCNSKQQSDEISINVTIEWRTSALQTRSITMTENLYRWLADGSGV